MVGNLAIFDLDGVIVTSYEASLKIARERFHNVPNIYDGRHLEFDHIKEYGSKEVVDAVWDMWCRGENYRTAVVYTGVKELISYLQSQGIKCVCYTHAYNMGSQIIRVKKEWVKEHLGIETVCVTSKEKIIPEAYMYFEDCVQNLQVNRSKVRHSFLITRLWNRDTPSPDGIMRVRMDTNLVSVVKAIVMMDKQSREKIAQHRRIIDRLTSKLDHMMVKMGEEKSKVRKKSLFREISKWCEQNYEEWWRNGQAKVVEKCNKMTRNKDRITDIDRIVAKYIMNKVKYELGNEVYEKLKKFIENEIGKSEDEIQKLNAYLAYCKINGEVVMCSLRAETSMRARGKVMQEIRKKVGKDKVLKEDVKIVRIEGNDIKIMRV